MMKNKQVASPNCDMNKNLGLDNTSWALNSEQGILSNGTVEYKLDQQIQEGDIIVSFFFWSPLFCCEGNKLANSPS